MPRAVRRPESCAVASFAVAGPLSEFAQSLGLLTLTPRGDGNAKLRSDVLDEDAISQRERRNARNTVRTTATCTTTLCRARSRSHVSIRTC